MLQGVSSWYSSPSPKMFCILISISKLSAVCDCILWWIGPLPCAPGPLGLAQGSLWPYINNKWYRRWMRDGWNVQCTHKYLQILRVCIHITCSSQAYPVYSMLDLMSNKAAAVFPQRKDRRLSKRVCGFNTEQHWTIFRIITRGWHTAGDVSTLCAAVTLVCDLTCQGDTVGMSRAVSEHWMESFALL